jgi:hypothetical protein
MSVSVCQWKGKIPSLAFFFWLVGGCMVTSVLKMETVRFSETLASTSQSTRRPNPEEHQKSDCLEGLIPGAGNFRERNHGTK